MAGTDGHCGPNAGRTEHEVLGRDHRVISGVRDRKGALELAPTTGIQPR